MKSTEPQKLFVALKSQTNADDLGFIVIADAEHTKTVQKRIDAAKRWAGYQCRTLYVDNTPKFGFAIVTNKSRYSTSNVVWRIRHPDGFEFEITSPNMCDLLSNSTIINGIIQDACFLTEKRELTNTKTEIYENKQTKINIKKECEEFFSTIVRGDKVRLQYTDPESSVTFTPEDYIYLGTFHALYRMTNSNCAVPKSSSLYHYLKSVTGDKLVAVPNFKNRLITCIKIGHDDIDESTALQKIKEIYDNIEQSGVYRNSNGIFVSNAITFLPFWIGTKKFKFADLKTKVEYFEWDIRTKSLTLPPNKFLTYNDDIVVGNYEHLNYSYNNSYSFVLSANTPFNYYTRAPKNFIRCDFISYRMRDGFDHKKILDVTDDIKYINRAAASYKTSETDSVKVQYGNNDNFYFTSVASTEPGDQILKFGKVSFYMDE